MKKVLGVSTFLLAMMTLVSAQGGIASGLSRGMSQVIGMIEGLLGPFFSAIFGGGSGMLFEKVLFLAIILTTVYMIVKKMPVFGNKEPVIWIVSISISLLSTRFMSAEMIQTMLLPYSTLGIALTAALPLLIFFAFVYNNGFTETVRRTLWIFYIVIFLTVWGTRYDTVGDIAWIYLASAGIAFLFFLWDGRIQKIILAQGREKLNQDIREDRAIQIRRRLKELERDNNEGIVTPERYKKKRKELEERLANTH